MIEIKPLKNCDAVVGIPGSKSYTHRALMVAALAEGESVLRNPLRSEDTDYTAAALEKFGVPILAEEDCFRVRGTGGRLKRGAETIFVGNSGTSMRFVIACAALRNGRTLLDGTARMRKRPVAPLLEGLQALGAAAYSQQGNGCPPVVVESRGLRGGTAGVDGRESSQYLSALLMISPLAEKDVRLEIKGGLASRPYVDITREVMSSFGVTVQLQGEQSFYVPGGQRYSGRTYGIEGDASNASYFLAAAAVTRGRVRVENFRPSSVQGDAGILGILEKIGCHVGRGQDWAEVWGKTLRGIEIDMNSMPDLVPTLAVIAAFARGETTLTRIGHLRLKESDRIHSLATELARMGIEVQEGDDWLKVRGGGAHAAEIQTYNDHRMAMAFAVAGLAVPGIRILGEDCVKKSFPAFWEKFQTLYES